MASTVGPATTGDTHHRAADVTELPMELARLWSDISQQIEADSGQMPLHTNILTLIAVAQGRSEERIVRETLNHLAEVQPSRAVAIYVEPRRTEIDARISASCRPREDERVSCYELVELRVPPAQILGVPSLLAPLELFDVPTFIWFVGEVDFTRPEIERHVTLAERVIVDTSRFEDAMQALAGYERFLHQEGHTCTGTDLTWARSTSWRELIAQSFDHPMARPLLRGIQNVEIDFDPPAESQALLLAGWLSSRLNWTPVVAERRGASILAQARDAEGAAVTVALNRQTSGGVGLRSIRILAKGPSGTARTTLRRRDERLASIIFETAGMRQERVIPDERPSVPELVSAELLVHTRDRFFEQALGCANRWLESIEGQT